MPPIWEVDSEGNSRWYIPPPGCRRSGPTSRDFDDPHPVSAITFSSVAPTPGCPAYVPASLSVGDTSFTIASASAGAPSTSTGATAEAPKRVDLRTTGYFCKIWNQGELGSCAPHAVAGAFAFAHQKQLDSQVNHFEPSRLFIHYNMREKFGEAQRDYGGPVYDGISSLTDQGVCAEVDWEYMPWGSHVSGSYVLTEDSRAAKRPSDLAYARALAHTVVSSVKLEVHKDAGTTSYIFDLDKLRKCLDDGYPFVFGCHIFKVAGFRRRGILEAPGDTDNGDDGMGHALMGVGYDDNARCFIIQNSWGPSWNRNGCFMMPYQIIAHQRVAYDFWTIREVKIEEEKEEEAEKAEENKEEKEKEW